jgi:hypothetical protein
VTPLPCPRVAALHDCPLRYGLRPSATKRRSKCGGDRGSPVLSSHFSPPCAAGWTVYSVYLLENRFRLHGPSRMRQSEQENCSILHRITRGMSVIRFEHLRVEIWSNLERKAVAVTFGGTVFTNITDWEANLWWFNPRHQDEYTIVVTTFGRDFVTDYLQRSNRPEFSFLREATIFSTGHSLDGGRPSHPAVPSPAALFWFSRPFSASVPGQASTRLTIRAVSPAELPVSVASPLQDEPRREGDSQPQ